jgi:hypothetical protein
MSQDIKVVEKEVDETTIQDATLDETKEGVENEVDTTKQVAPTVEEVDYKAEYEKVKTNLDKAEHKIVELKTKKDDKDEFSFVDEPVDSEEDIDSKIAKKVSEALIASRAEMTKELMSDVINEELSQLSSNEDERKLIKLHYENSIKQSGLSRESIKEDLNKAYLIANQSKFLKERKEMVEAMKAKNSIQNSSVGTNQSHEKVTKVPTLSEADIAFCRKHGIDPKTVDFTQVKR